METDKAELASLEKSAQEVKASKPTVPVSQAAVTPDGKTCVTFEQTVRSMLSERITAGTKPPWLGP